jgi:plastocyanin
MAMHTTRKLNMAVAAIAASFLSAVGMVSPVEAEQAKPEITITNEGATYVYSPAQLDAKAGQAITLTNTDANGVHSVTAQDRSFSVDVPPRSSVALTVPKAGSYPYYCQYHPDTHNAASITVS